MKFYHVALCGLGLISAAGAADMTIFYSPSCPHCHRARNFIRTELVYEYDDLAVTEVNAVLAENRGDFINALQKCGYTKGGVPVIMIGDKCFQGYGENMNDSIRAAVEVDYTDDQRNAAKTNREELNKDHDAFVAAHAARQDAVVNKDEAKKN